MKVLNVPEMHCGVCVRRIKKAFRGAYTKQKLISKRRQSPYIKMPR